MRQENRPQEGAASGNQVGDQPKISVPDLVGAATHDRALDNGKRGLDLAQIVELLGYHDGEHVALAWREPGGEFVPEPVPVVELLARVVELDENVNVWFAPNPTSARGFGVKGAASQTTRLVALTADLDAKDGGLGTLEACEMVIAELALMLGTEPTIVIFSGHGLQPIWLIYLQGAGIDNTDNFNDLQAIVRRFGRLVAGVAGQVGGNVDSVYSLDRLVRVPGTMNVKVPDAPVMATAYAGGGAPITLDHLNSVLDEFNVQDCKEDHETLTDDELSDPEYWDFAGQTSSYVRAMIEGWKGDTPEARHPYLLSCGIRLACAWRLGQISEEDYRNGREVARSRFLWLLANCEPVREPGFGEIQAALGHDAIARASRKIDDACWIEIGGYPRDGSDLVTKDREDLVFDLTPELRWLRDLARARMVSPWALLLAVTARAISASSPLLQIPAYVGTRTSLNIFVAMVGTSSSGKTAAASVASEVLEISPWTDLRNPSSGEGLVALFAHIAKGGEPGEIRDRVLSQIDEIGILGSQQDRSGSILSAILRAAWSGEFLSNHAADKSRQRYVEAHSYRYCMIGGVQYDKADVLMKDEGAGTPQRFLWVPATDRHAVLDHPEPGSNPFRSWEPQSVQKITDMKFPDHVRNSVRQTRLDGVRNGSSDRDSIRGHSLLVRMKVAAGLALLHGTIEVSEDLWMASGVIAELSDETLTSIIKHRGKKREAVSSQRGRDDAIREHSKDEGLSESGAASVGRKVHSGTDRETFNKTALRRHLGRKSKYVDQAIGTALERGYIAEATTTTKGGKNRTVYVRGKNSPPQRS